MSEAKIATPTQKPSHDPGRMVVINDKVVAELRWRLGADATRSALRFKDGIVVRARESVVTEQLVRSLGVRRPLFIRPVPRASARTLCLRIGCVRRALFLAQYFAVALHPRACLFSLTWLTERVESMPPSRAAREFVEGLLGAAFRARAAHSSGLLSNERTHSW